MVQARVRRNDARILAAALQLLADEGWAGLSLAHVGRAAGLSIRPVRDRFVDRGALAAAVWQDSAGPALREALSRCLVAAGLLPAQEGIPAEGLADGDVPALEAALDALARPDIPLRAAADLAVLASFDAKIRAVVAESVGAAIARWVSLQDAGSAERAAKRAYLLALGLGLLAAAHRPRIDNLDLHPVWRRYAKVLADDRSPTRLPIEPRPAHITVVPFDTGDDITDALLRAALDHLAESGYEGAVLTDLVRTAGYSEGTVFARYPSKEALFLDAIKRNQDIAMPGQREYLQRMETKHGVGVAEAVAIRDAMRPQERRACVIDIEHTRMTWHNPALAEVEEQRLQALAAQVLAQEPDHPDFADPANMHVARAMGLGISFLPLLVDNAWDLPFDVVTVPLAELTYVQDT